MELLMTVLGGGGGGVEERMKQTEDTTQTGRARRSAMQMDGTGALSTQNGAENDGRPGARVNSVNRAKMGNHPRQLYLSQVDQDIWANILGILNLHV